MNLLYRFGFTKIINFLLFLSVVTIFSGVFKSIQLNRSYIDLTEKQNHFLLQNQLITQCISSVNKTNLAAMDVIVDSDSGRIEEEHTQEVESFRKMWTENESKYEIIFSEEGQSEEFQKLKSSFNILFSAIDKLWRSVETKTVTKKLLDSVDNEIDENSVILKEAFEKISIVYQEKLKHLQDGVVIASNDNFGIQIFLSLTLLFIQLFLSLPLNIFSGKTLRHSMEELLASNETVEESSSELAKKGKEIGETSAKQKSSVMESAAAVTQMQSVIRKNSETLSSTRKQSQDANARSQEGLSQIQTLLRSMEDIAQVRKDMSNIVQIIENIREKTNQINNIVFKTQILSFNASIEAVKAGPHGKGFAVVATEVGRLADISGATASEIESIVKSGIQMATETASEVSEKIREANVTAEKSANFFQNISNDVISITHFVDDIISAVEQQNIGVDQFSSSMKQLNEIASRNTDLANDINIHVEHMNKNIDIINQKTDHVHSLIVGKTNSRDRNTIEDHEVKKYHKNKDSGKMVQKILSKINK